MVATWSENKMNGRKKLKVSMPTLREKERYIAFEILSEEEITFSDLESAIWNTAQDFFGELGTSRISLWIIKNLYDEQKQLGVIRCNNLSVDKVLTTLGLITRLGDTRVIFKIHKISGTIKGLD
jgi:ribonuclease P/MRP protein subunit POP5